MREIPDSRLPWTDRCLFCSRCLDRGRRNRFPPFCLDGFLKHAAFEEGIANQKRLKAPLKQFQRISSLDNNSAVFTAMPKYRTSVTSNISTPSLFTMHTCQQTVTVKCFQLRLDLLLPLKKNKNKETSDHHRGWYRHLLPYMSRWEWSTKARWFHFVSAKQKNRKDKERRRHETEALCRSRQECHLCARRHIWAAIGNRFLPLATTAKSLREFRETLKGARRSFRGRNSNSEICIPPCLKLKQWQGPPHVNKGYPLRPPPLIILDLFCF